MIVKKTMLALLVVNILFGCSFKPHVTYIRDPSEDYEGLIKFSLAKSIITIAKSGAGIEAKVFPSEAPNARYGIQNGRRWGRKIYLSYTKYNDTEVFATVGSKMTDKSLIIIEQAGNALNNLLPLVFVEAKIEKIPKNDLPSKDLTLDKVLPIAIDTIELLDKENRGSYSEQGKTGKVGYKITVGEAPKDSINIKDFDLNRAKSILFYSACRHVKLEIQDYDGGKFKEQPGSISLKIADPNFVQTIAIPEKGVVTMHPSCGANVSYESAEIATEAEIASKMAVHAKSLADAMKTKKDVSKNE